jgi:hypothetical protein
LSFLFSRATGKLANNVAQQYRKSFGVYRLTLPYRSDAPPRRNEFAPDFTVAPTVSGSLRKPIITVGRGYPTTAFAIVPVPETTMNENDRSVPPQRYVRRPRQFGRVKTVSIAHRVQRAADAHFGARVT